MRAADLLAHAQRLTRPARGRPSQADLRRAVSAAYYALFHAIAATAADTLIGTTAAHRLSPTWRRVYRSLEHGYAKSQCMVRPPATQIPLPLTDVADAFVQLQELRQEADYDPGASFLRTDVEAHIAQATTAVSLLGTASLGERRALAAWLVFRTRG